MMHLKKSVFTVAKMIENPFLLHYSHVVPVLFQVLKRGGCDSE